MYLQYGHVAIQGYDRDSKYLKLLWDAAEERRCGEIESAINRVEKEVEDADEEIQELGKEVLELKDKVRSVWRKIVGAAENEKSTLKSGGRG
jgi:vacuolar-type H+-ATPase subunit H